VDVTTIVKDKEKLKAEYKRVTRYEDCEILSVESKPITIQGKEYLTPNVLGPDNENTTAIVIKLNSGDGTVRILRGEDDVDLYNTRAKAPDKAIMVFLDPGLYCYLIPKVVALYIKRPKSA